ncbi:MAG TPA: transglutaminase domain-containing protein [Thermoanaerobaculia bacterium]|nr:transglutaminase domain-containing protein [Thermoanaerobaculia bacterium]
MTRDQRRFVAPHHPLVRQLLAEAAADGDPLSATLAALARRCRYVASPPGHRSFDQVAEELATTPAGDAVDLNCITLSSLVVSCLRTAGFDAHEVLVAVGARRQELGFDTLRIPHAWALVGTPGGLVAIDPVDLRPRATSAQALPEEIHLYVLFNDEQLFFTENEKKAALAEVAWRGRPRLYLFGRPDPDLWALAQRPEVERTLHCLFHQPRVPREPVSAQLHQRALEARLLRADGEDLAVGSRVVPVPREAERAFHCLARPLIDHYLAVVAATVPALQSAWEGCAAARDFSWQEVAHAVVAGLFIDLAVGRRLGIADEVHEDQGPSVLWLFEALSGGEPFGVQWIGHPERLCAFAQLWHRRVGRTPPTLARPLLDLLAGLAEADAVPPGSRSWLLLRHLGLARSFAPSARGLVFPVFGPADTSLLEEPLGRGAERVVSEVLMPAFELAAEDPWWRRSRQQRAFRHAIVRLMLEYVIDRAVAERVVPPFPPAAEASPGWGRWLWSEPEGAPSLFPRPAHAGREEPCLRSA